MITIDDAKYVAEAYGFLTYGKGAMTGTQFGQTIERYFAQINKRNEWARDVAITMIKSIIYNGQTIKYRIVGKEETV